MKAVLSSALLLWYRLLFCNKPCTVDLTLESADGIIKYDFPNESQGGSYFFESADDILNNEPFR